MGSEVMVQSQISLGLGLLILVLTGHILGSASEVGVWLQKSRFSVRIVDFQVKEFRFLVLKSEFLVWESDLLFL